MKRHAHCEAKAVCEWKVRGEKDTKVTERMK